MKTMLIGALATLAVSGAVAHDGASASRAADAARVQSDASYAVYRHVVLGDTSVAIPSRQTTSARWDVGPYARYLMHNGASYDEALAQARTFGEEPGLVVAVPSRSNAPLSHYDRYRHVVLGTPLTEIVGRSTTQAAFAGPQGAQAATH